MGIRVAVVTLVAAAALAVVGNAAAQAPPPPPLDPNQPVSAPPSGPSILGALDITAPSRGAVVAHAGHPCYGQTMNPHNSTHYPGYALVSGRTVCNPHSVTVTVDLYRELFSSWYWLNRGGPKTGVVTVQTHAKWKCSSGSRQHFRGVSYHSAGGGHYWTGPTANEATFTCN